MARDSLESDQIRGVQRREGSGTFLDLVCTKNAKREEYGENIATVDLVIHDADSILAYYSVKDWMRAIHRINAADCITKSPFREIYAVTAREPNRQVCVPLRAALFVAEIVAFRAMFKAFYSASLESVTFGEYLKALAIYSRVGSRDLNANWMIAIGSISCLQAWRCRMATRVRAWKSATYLSTAPTGERS